MSRRPRIGSRAWLVGVRSRFGSGNWQFCQLYGIYHDKRELSRAIHNGYVDEVEVYDTYSGCRVKTWHITKKGMTRWKDAIIHEEKSGTSENTPANRVNRSRRVTTKTQETSVQDVLQSWSSDESR